MKSKNYIPIEKMNRHQRYKERHMALGLCRSCSEPAKPGQVLCEKHARENITRTLKNKDKRREERRCLECGQPLDEGSTESCHPRNDCYPYRRTT